MSSTLSLFSSQPVKSFFLKIQRSCFSHEHIFGKFLSAGNQIVTSCLLAMTYALGGVFVPTLVFCKCPHWIKRRPHKSKVDFRSCYEGSKAIHTSRDLPLPGKPTPCQQSQAQLNTVQKSLQVQEFVVFFFNLCAK